MSKFNTTNELNNFDFKDCYITEVNLSKDLIFEVEALIVRASNSANANFTDSYAGTTRICFKNAKLLGGVRDGYKYYNANDELIKAVEDTVLTDDEVNKVLKESAGMYLYEIASTDNRYEVHLEAVDEDEYNTAGDSFSIMVECEQIDIGWDRYMNRVEK